MLNHLENLPRTKGPEILADKKAAQKSAPPIGAFDIRENSLCAELGMSPDELLRRRTYFLERGRHWEYVSKRVLYARVGAEILRSTRESVVPASPAKNAATADSVRRRKPVALLCERNPPPVEFTGKLIAWAVPGHNRRIVVCYLPGTDPENPLNLVTLRVRDNGNFLRGMVLPGRGNGGRIVGVVTRVKERADTYDLQGPVPRWRGKW